MGAAACRARRKRGAVMSARVDRSPVALAGGFLARQPSGRLRFTAADGLIHDAVVAVRAFPISQPDRGFSLMTADGHELVWIERLAELADDARALFEEALAEREFMPEIVRLIGVSGFVTPCTWDIETHRGITRFVLKGEEDIRRLGAMTLLITDSDGIHYLLRDVAALDRSSRRLLDRFL